MVAKGFFFLPHPSVRPSVGRRRRGLGRRRLLRPRLLSSSSQPEQKRENAALFLGGLKDFLFEDIKQEGDDS